MLTPFAKDVVVGVVLILGIVWVLAYGAGIAMRYLSQDDPDWKGRR